MNILFINCFLISLVYNFGFINGYNWPQVFQQLRTQTISNHAFQIKRRSCIVLKMGRASAVRANTKARTDAAKMKLRDRYGKRVLMAIRVGGGTDPTVNRLLAQVIAEAKAADVPKEVITRNIEKHSQGSFNLKESLVEIYGLGGIGILVNLLTDNEVGAHQEINAIMKKKQDKSNPIAFFKIAATNAVAFQFTKKMFCYIRPKEQHSEDLKKQPISKVPISEDELLHIALNQGVEEYMIEDAEQARRHASSPGNDDESDGTVVISVDQKDQTAITAGLEQRGYSVHSQMRYKPLDGFKRVKAEDFEANQAFISALEELDDVDTIQHNTDLVNTL
jgi:transcriptional/translational regulatory protein YebC/TACO1